MKKHLWKLMGLAMLLALLVGAMPLAAEEAEPVGPVNRLRVYGEKGHATFPYTTFDGPFNLLSTEAPEKDFVVFNAGIFVDPQFRDGKFYEGDPLAPYITCNDRDAAEKVHARMWYEPDLCQPLGDTEPEVEEEACGDHIVFEYTYIMLDDDTLNPVACKECESQMIFPMAGLGGQLGLDRYNVGPYDGINQPAPGATDQLMKIEQIDPIAGGSEMDFTIKVSPTGALRVEEGQWIEFFDYALKVIDAPTTNEQKVEVAIYYTGFKHNYVGMDSYVGRASLWTGDMAAVDARKGPVRVSTSPEFWRAPKAVERPFWIHAEHVGTDYVRLVPYRILQTGESFFVDGAEYAVAGIYAEGTGDQIVQLNRVVGETLDQVSDSLYGPVANENEGGGYFADCNGDGFVDADDVRAFVDGIEQPVKAIGPNSGNVRLFQDFGNDGDVEVNYCYTILNDEYALKQITLRNPLPKGDDEVLVDDMTVYKKEVAANTSLPMLPPFNMEHAMVDDVNFAASKTSDPNKGNLADKQYADGNLWTRIIDGAKPYDGENGDPESFIAWTEETKEGRFDTNLMEEKFSEPEEQWEWINIETKPWDYTEFILPLRPDITKDGDYILVSSWKTQDDARVKFAYDAAIGQIRSADIYVNDADYNLEYYGVDANSLRAYGLCTFNAAFPYTRFDGPFNIGNANDEKPDKDFIVHNPAYLDHRDGGLYGRIAADGNADQKVHMRTWYVPKYDEPAGFTKPTVDPVSNDEEYGHGDIVNEYTYLLLDDTTNNPTHGKYETTRMVFPMAGLGEAVGLDRYDVNGDGSPEIMSIEGIYGRYDAGRDAAPGTTWCITETTLGTIIVSPQETDATEMRLQEGQMLQFLDYAVELVDISTNETQVDFNVYYLGQAYDTLQGPVTVDLLASQWGLWDNTAIVEAGKPIQVRTTSWWSGHFDDIAWTELTPVVEPFGFRIDHVSTDYVTIKPFRMLTAGETFFVDGAEYDVAAIGVVPGDTESEAHPGNDLCELKYVTIRNPIPKCDPTAADACSDLFIPGLTVYKTRFGPQEILPVLPPFNHTHDRVDDINIPELGSGADVQRFDNLDLCTDEPYRCWPYPDPQIDFEFPPGSGRYWGETSLIHDLFNTIKERIVEDVDPLEFYWLAEEKEERFDTSLGEEKWIKGTSSNSCPVGEECWQWINIETLPWHYTEFVLPDIPDKPQEYGLDILGDYILVSSFTTQDDSPDDGEPVRVKFAYDPSDGTGLYVNADLCEPARVLDLSSNSPVDQYGTVELYGVVNDATESWTWDFGDLTGCTGEDTANPTCDAEEAGTFEVCLTAENDCPSSHTVCTDVVIEPCPGDFNDDTFRDLADIMLMLPAWNTRCGDATYEAMFDFNDDCYIGLFDIMQVVAVWNTPCPGCAP